MKVKDLIEKLTKVDDNLNVVFMITCDDSCTTTCENVDIELDDDGKTVYISGG